MLTVDAVAVNGALTEPPATVTVGGTAIALLLLPRLTVMPPLGAAAFKVTTQLSVPEPVIVPLLHASPVSTGTPVPLRLTTAAGFVEALLVIVN